MSTFTRRLALSFTVAGVVAASALVAAPAQAAGACTALSGKFGTSDGAAGTIYNVFVLTNTSNTSCTMSGYPSLTRYAADGRKQSTTVSKDIDPGPTSVTLKPGGKASFVWAYTDVPSGSGTCGTTRVLGVTAPGSSTRLYMAKKFPQCSNRLSVSAIAKGVITP